MGFLTERNNNEPQIDMDNFKEMTNNIIRYLKETMGLYDKKFGAEVAIIHQEYPKRNIKSAQLEALYKHPTNPLGIREVAFGLIELAGKLEKKMNEYYEENMKKK